MSLALSVNGNVASASILDDYQSTATQLSKLKSDKDNLAVELKDLSTKLGLTDSQIAAVQAKITATLSTLTQIEASLADRKGKIAIQETLRDAAVLDYYKRGEVIPLVLLFSSNSWQEWPERLIYFKVTLNNVRATVTNLNDEITNFEANKAEALSIKNQLLAQQQALANLQSKLKNQANEASARLSQYAAQEAILGQKLSDLSAEISSQMSWQQSAVQNIKESGSGRPNTPNASGAPSWRIGGYGTEHGVGMSQWGAFMLAAQGWDEERILKFYYHDIDFKTVSKDSINVEGYGSMNFEDEYLAGIGETDPVWRTINSDAAAVMDRVQIIAARTYAINNSSICTTQACQVYIGGTAKKDAADKTRGKIMVYSGEPIRAFYFSTSGPHTDSIGDTPSFAFNSDTRQYKDSGSINDAYPYLRSTDFNDTMSPYNNWSALMSNSWKTQSFPPKKDSSEGTQIGQIDMGDVLNTALLSPSDLDKVSSKTSMEDVRSMLKSEGKTPIEAVKSVSVETMGGSSSRVKWVKAEGSNRSIDSGEITGIRFRYAFNVRSPEKDWIYSTWFEVK